MPNAWRQQVCGGRQGLKHFEILNSYIYIYIGYIGKLGRGWKVALPVRQGAMQCNVTDPVLYDMVTMLRVQT